MEYVQERITTLHDFGGLATKSGLTNTNTDADTTSTVDSAHASPIAQTAVIVPMTAREHRNPAAARVLSELESLEPAPAAVYVPVRASADEFPAFREWLTSFSLPVRVLWCSAPAVETVLARAGLDGKFGKGRDVWLALGPAAATGEYVVVHDADARSYTADHVRRLLAPLAMDAGFEFSKGYYARIEDDRLYGRLFRLFYAPVLRALASDHDAPILEYLQSFRYALAGEFALTAELATQLRTPRTWGLEVGTLGDAFEHAGFAGTAQVDLGQHVHDHRAVAGKTGLEGMSREVAGTLFRVLEAGGIHPNYETLADRYRTAGLALLDQYRADAAFNGLEYDYAGERDQLERYANAIGPPGVDRRLPRWTDTALEAAAVVDATQPWINQTNESSLGSQVQD